jgi:hypothetical protein
LVSRRHYRGSHVGKPSSLPSFWRFQILKWRFLGCYYRSFNILLACRLFNFCLRLFASLFHLLLFFHLRNQRFLHILDLLSELTDLLLLFFYFELLNVVLLRLLCNFLDIFFVGGLLEICIHCYTDHNFLIFILRFRPLLVIL